MAYLFKAFLKATAFASFLICASLPAAENGEKAGNDDNLVAPNAIWLLELKGVIGPANADYVIRGLRRAAESDARLVVLQIDTPGGLDKSMRSMIKAILASPVAVTTYVAPSGARAASAGTYILYASHVAAMAPATNLGAATPVQIGAPGLPELPDKSGDKSDKKDPDGSSDEKDDARVPAPKTAMQRKALNDAMAYIEGLAELRGRNAGWAVKAVREAASLPAKQALAENVIDIVADDLDDLLKQLEGREVQVGGKSVVLKTTGADIYTYKADWRTKFLAVITDPNVAYILMLMGIYGLIFEFSHPGAILPGVIGAISILLALYAFQVLPVSYAGLGLIFLGIALMVTEALSPSFGVLGIGGLIAFVVGSIILMDTQLPAFRIAVPIILAAAAFSAGLLILLLGMVIRARQQVVVTGLGYLVGMESEVEQVHKGQALVRLQGELWQVKSAQPLKAGDRVRVNIADGVVLTVEKI